MDSAKKSARQKKKPIFAERARLKALRDAKREKEMKEEAKLHKNAGERMKKDAPAMLEAFVQRADIKEETKKIIRWSDKMDVWYFDYLGFDAKHESIVIVNQNRSTGEVFNIKHHKKWAWDEMSKSYTEGVRSSGKWISQHGSATSPFPMEYFLGHDDERVVISFGEKVMNLLSYNINTLTLGGISNSFEAFAHLLKDKVVYIWADHQ